ncbi:MAG: hypothetical protein ABIS50_25115 [Luteolibacter sp.]|uniref:hypothetical protein n=1 Tax=Luteolibacter sp. TaxID=1962973 RepID=UPI0032666D08
MNFPATLFFFAVAVALWTVPRRLAPVPLLIGCCYMTMGQSLNLGLINLPIFRMLLIVGMVRVFAKKEFAPGGRNKIDTLVILWGCWVMFASFFHQYIPGSGPIYTSGVVMNVTFVYFLFRNWIRDAGEIADIAKALAIILTPVAIEMAMERVTGKNNFSVFGYVPANVDMREGKFRAQGPFGHSILAGTVGAVCFPLMVGIWSRHRRSAILGIMVCLFMIFASASSGPIMSLLMGIGAIMLWYQRPLVSVLRWAAVGTYLIAELVMTRPAYYLISKIDLTGGSTGWHRSQLMETFFAHFSEWWFAGTDHTRHWMPYGVPIGNGNHIDITNYYITFAILGGLPSMLLVIWILTKAFSWIGKILQYDDILEVDDQFMVWCMGAGMMAHAATSISVAYFDQSMIFFWLNVAVISSFYSSVSLEADEDEMDFAAEIEGVRHDRHPPPAHHGI